MHVTFGIEAAEKLRVAEQKPQIGNAIKLVLQRLIGIDSKIGRNNRKLRVRANVFAEELANRATTMIVTNACFHLAQVLSDTA